MKKIFSILFPIYFIALVMMPCGDKENCNEVNPSQLSQTSHHEEHSDEICSPFCSCSCCATSFLVKDFMGALTQIAIINTVYTAHEEKKTGAPIIPIWQPPKA